MRPVERGQTPQVNGVDKIVSDYKDWRQDLLDVIGNYCCYCNMVLNDSPQVEHVVPKNPRPGQPAGALLAWSNMLLACGPCNRAKDNNPNNTTTHYIPDYHNTHLAFDFVVVNHPVKVSQMACIPQPKSTLTPQQQQKATATITLCNLQALTYNKRATDLRWKYRFEAFTIATEWRTNWDAWGHQNAAPFIALLMTAALSKGFYSIWFNAFHDIAPVKSALVNGFIGTHKPSFPPAQYDPTIRVVGDL